MASRIGSEGSRAERQRTPRIHVRTVRRQLGLPLLLARAAGEEAGFTSGSPRSLCVSDVYRDFSS